MCSQFLFMGGNPTLHGTVAVAELLGSMYGLAHKVPGPKSNRKHVGHFREMLGRMSPVVMPDRRLALQEEWAANP